MIYLFSLLYCIWYFFIVEFVCIYVYVHFNENKVSLFLYLECNFQIDIPSVEMLFFPK